MPEGPSDTVAAKYSQIVNLRPSDLYYIFIQWMIIDMQNLSDSGRQGQTRDTSNYSVNTHRANSGLVCWILTIHLLPGTLRT